MTVSPISRPLASSQKNVDDIESALRGDYAEQKSRRHHQSMTMQDARVNTFVSVIGMTLATLMTAAIIWSAKATVELENEMVGVQRDIATLLARPPSVPWEDYNRDEQRRDADISNLKDEIRRLPHK